VCSRGPRRSGKPVSFIDDLRTEVGFEMVHCHLLCKKRRQRKDQDPKSLPVLNAVYIKIQWVMRS